MERRSSQSVEKSGLAACVLVTAEVRTDWLALRLSIPALQGNRRFGRYSFRVEQSWVEDEPAIEAT